MYKVSYNELTEYERFYTKNNIVKMFKRLDNRRFLEGRNVRMLFGHGKDCCVINLQNTKVIAKLEYDAIEPNASTPNEGTIRVNFDLQSIWVRQVEDRARIYENGREIQKSLERCIIDSKVVDLGSLCIIPGYKVWALRLDVEVLYDEGNLMEAANIAATAVLAYCKLPAVTIEGSDVKVHYGKEAMPLNIKFHLMPISINLALFDGGKCIIVDPLDSEEKYSDSCCIVDVLAHQERCYVHQCSALMLKEEDRQKCEHVAIKRAREIIEILGEALETHSNREIDGLFSRFEEVKI